MSAQPVYKQQYTLEEYIELEKNSDEKYEYFDGEVFAMAGGSPDHARICANLNAMLQQKLRGGNCEAFNSDLRIKVPSARPYRYPDVTVVCGEQQYEEIHGLQALVNPVLIVEAPFSSTAAYDLNEKFIAYRSIESFREYLLISQTRPHVIQYVRQPGGKWLRGDVSGLESEIALESIEVTLSLREIYERVKFQLQPKEGRLPPT
jgi:Uma2 family endonuclease